jgi:ABC-type multidrug transport system ATPase subunit
MRREPTLTCVSIRKARRRRQVLAGADLEVARGESVAIVGENGSGKSTLLNICAGVVRPDAGRVQRASRTGLCPQQPGLVDLLTVDDHVRLTAAGTNEPRAARRRTRALLDELGLDAGSTTTAAELSGGQRQKLNLALTLTDDPQLLLLDEPYQGFDHGSYLSLWDMIGRWTREGRSVVVITHLLAEHERVDRVLTLSNGVLR